MRAAGRLKWHYQFTPHNVWDWDAQQPTVLVDTTWEGRPRKLLVQASRNGFFYVLDRTDGKFLLATPFVNHLTWAREIGTDGRPVLVPGQVPSPEGTRVCPSAHGAANWYSTSYSPPTGLYYVQTLENCNVFVKFVSEWVAGKSYWGGSTRQAADAPNQKILRAIDVKTGKVAWELPQTGPGRRARRHTRHGDRPAVLLRRPGSIRRRRCGNRQTALAIRDEQRVARLADDLSVRRQQHIAIASGSNIIAFGL